MSPCNYSHPQILSGEENSGYFGSGDAKINSVSPKPFSNFMPRNLPSNQPSPTVDELLMLKQRLHFLRSKKQSTNKHHVTFSAQNSPKITRRQSLINQQHLNLNSPISNQHRATASSRPSLQNFGASPHVASDSSFYDHNVVDAISCASRSNNHPSNLSNGKSNYKHRRKQYFSPNIKGLNCCFKDL